MYNPLSPGWRFACAVSALALLSGCASLPSSGPTARQVVRGAHDKESTINFDVVELDGVAMRKLAELSRVPVAGTFSSLAREGRVDTIAPGDELQITIYEVGMTLFGGAAAISGGVSAAVPDVVDPIAKPKPLGSVTVASDGTIRLPYVGRLSVEGSTAYDVQRMIEQALHGKSQSPQAMVTIASSPHNSVYISGAVSRAGRMPLSVARESLLDAITSAGGSRSPSTDTVVRMTRGGQTAEMRLADIGVGGSNDLRLLPGDRIELIEQQRSYSVFGAAKVGEEKFEGPRVSLAEALARVGGPSDTQADPTAVFLFRYDADALAQGQRPVIYRLNLMRPESYIVAQNVAMRDKDLIYVANAASGPVTKFIGVLNQLFAPVFTVQSLTRSTN